ncbi:Abi-like protein [Caprobacter fermentans]|uniref:Abi-like protein n=1 Tax=Caproicibacter fermentans TaxID=2576756 RepID=A0A6N8I0W7_9FIRM|nr:Abi family protein [Caproicibacter fermentans]MVB11357.1 Abi-like protein [Caproicibacter fermentans]
MQEAKKFLLRNNYYRLSGFTLCHRKNDVFMENTYFEDLIAICEFDCELRTLLMGLLGRIEITYKSLIAYFHTKKYGPLGYESSDSFSNVEIYATLVCKIAKLKKHYEDNPERFLKHYVEDRDGRLPFWAVMELINFTDTSKIYSALTDKIKSDIVFAYPGLTFGTAPDYVENWLRCASVLRNIAAHRGRLYNRTLSIKPKLSRESKDLLSQDKTGNPVLNKLFAYLIALKNLEPDKELWENLSYDIKELSYRYPFVNLQKYGFPLDWKIKLEHA